MPLVEIPGVGNVQFPDDMPPEQISAEAARLHAEASAPAPDVPITGRNVARSALQGLTLGFGDEITGGLVAGIGKLTGDERPIGDIYREARDAERAELAAFEEANPKTALASSIGGGVISGGLGAARALATPVGKFAAAKLANIPLRSRVPIIAGTSAATGTVGGAVGGAGAAEELSDVPREAAVGAGIGAGMGSALGPFAEVATTAVPAVVGAARRAFDPVTASNRMVRRSLTDSGLETLADARGRLAELGEGARIADVGEGTQARLDWLAQRPGATRQAVTDELLPRSREQIGEVMEPLGAGRRLEALDALKAQRAEVASPLYERAFAQGVEQTEELDKIFRELEASDPGIWADARRSGIREALGEGTDLNPAMYGTDVVPSLRGWQAMKTHLDALEGRAKRAGDNPTARQYGNVRRRLLRELDRQNPDYRAAREMWAGSMEFENFIEDGAGFMRPGQSAAVVERTLSEMSPTQKEAYRIGAVQAVEDRLSNQGWTHDATRFFKTPAMERKLRALFDSDDEFSGFMRNLDASATKQRTFAMASGGPDTARRLLYEGEQVPEMLIGFGADMATQGTPGAANNLVSRLARRVPTSRASTRDLAGQALLESDPARQAALLREMYFPTPMAMPGAGLATPLALAPIAGMAAPSLAGAFATQPQPRRRERNR